MFSEVRYHVDMVRKEMRGGRKVWFGREVSWQVWVRLGMCVYEREAASSRAKAGDKWRREGPLTVATHGAASRGLENHRQRVGAVMATITRVGKGKVGHVCLREGGGKQSSEGRRQVAS